MKGPGDILRVAAARWGPKTALITARRSLSFAELDELSNGYSPVAFGRPS
jgi:non-ribosomal peptide synthetase component E (peptide arylation enzyme)